MMVELARLQKTERLVQLRRIAEITGLSNNYLAQLAISLKDNGLLVGISGKKGGYQLSRSPEQITISEIIKAAQGPIFATDCVVNPDLCLNADRCEARTIWALMTHKMQEAMEEYTLADLIDPAWMTNVRESHPDVEFLNASVRLTGEQRAALGKSTYATCQRELPKEDKRR